MTYTFDVRKAIFVAIILAGMIAAPIAFGGHGVKPYMILKAGPPGGCWPDHSHSTAHTICFADTQGYEYCVADADYQCQELHSVSYVKDQVGSYCTEECPGDPGWE